MPSHTEPECLEGPGSPTPQQRHRDGGAAAPARPPAGPAASAPAAGSSAATVCRIDLATGIYVMVWQLFVCAHLARPLSGRELAVQAARFMTIAAPTLSIWLAPRPWL